MTKTEFPEGRGVRFGSQFSENPDGRGGGGHRKNPFRGGYGYFLELHNLEKVDEWYEFNQMKRNHSKYQAITFGRVERNLC